MFRSIASSVALGLVLAGCSGLAQKDSDQTPINRTAVLEMHMVNEGIKSFPAFESTTRTYTQAAMRRIESNVTGNSSLARFLGGASADVRIERPDRTVVWTLNTEKMQYTECPLKGCLGPIPVKPPPKKFADDEKTLDAECRLKIGTTTFTIEPTGRKRSINGFDTEQYDIKWLVVFRDNASRKSISTLNIDVWTARVTPGLKDATELEKTYARAHGKILGIDTDTDTMMLLPPEVNRMLNSYLSGNVSSTDRAKFLAGARKLDKVKGQPVLMNVKWSFTGEACSTEESMKDVGDKPLFTFIWEVKLRRIEPRHDSLFAPPKGYKRTK